MPRSESLPYRIDGVIAGQSLRCVLEDIDPGEALAIFGYYVLHIEERGRSGDTVRLERRCCGQRECREWNTIRSRTHGPLEWTNAESITISTTGSASAYTINVSNNSVWDNVIYRPASGLSTITNNYITYQ